MNNRTSILREAERLVTKDRDAQHGDPIENFKRVATMWSGYLGIEVKPVDVGWMMAIFKAARGRHAPSNRDSYADAAGYVACAWDVAPKALSFEPLVAE